MLLLSYFRVDIHRAEHMKEVKYTAQHTGCVHEQEYDEEKVGWQTQHRWK